MQTVGVPRQKNQKVYPGIKQDGWSSILRDREMDKRCGGECTSSDIHQVTVELRLFPPIGCHSKCSGEGDDAKERNEESQRGIARVEVKYFITDEDSE